MTPQLWALLLQGLWLHTTETYSRALTLVRALEAARGAAWLNAATRLTVHVIYSGEEDLMAVARLLPALRELRVLLCGLRFSYSTDASRGEGCGGACETCESCARAGKRRWYALARGQYEEVLARRSGEVPDVVVAYNAVMYEEAGGVEGTLASALGSGAPLVCTHHAEDTCREDLGVVVGWGRGRRLRVVLPPHCNPYASLIVREDMVPVAGGAGAGGLYGGL